MPKLQGINHLIGMNSKYEILLYWNQADQIFIAEVPELAGCMADGQTFAGLNHYSRVVGNGPRVGTTHSATQR